MSLDNIMTKVDLDDYTSEVKEYVGGGIRNVYKSIGNNGAKNLLPITLANIKANNTSGTWNDNKYTIAGVTFTVNTDNNGNVLSITADGTANAAALLILKIGNYININTQYMLSGCPNGGGDNKYRQYVYDLHAFNQDDNGDGVVFTYNGNYLSNLVWRIAIYSGYTANNLTFYPMIRLASDTDPTFQPYAKTNLELTNQVDSVTDITDMTEVNDTTPYLYKSSSHNAVYDKLVGASFGWNSILHNGDFANANYWGSYGQMVITNISNNTATITSTSDSGYPYERDFFQTNISVNKEHKYLIKASIKPTINMNMTFMFGSETPNKLITANQWNDMYGIAIPNSTSVSFIVHTNTLMTNTQSYQLKNIYIIDLTLLYGIELADYVYSIEQATTGSGVAWLKSYGFFTKDYYPYNAGSIQSVKTSGKKVVGKNLVDIIPTTQTKASIEYNVTTNNLISSKGPTTGATGNSDLLMSFNHPIKFIKGVKYYIGLLNLKGSNLGGKIGIWLGEYELLIDYLTNENQHCISFTPNEDMEYSKLVYRHYLGSINNYSGNLYISKTALSTYEPYTSTTYPLGNDELRGIPKLINNQLVYDGDVKTSDGVISRRYIESILPTSNWIINSNSSINLILQNTAPNSISVDNSDAISRIICSHHLVGYSANYLVNNMLLGDVCDSIAIISNNRFLVVVSKSKYATVADFESYLANNNVRVVYELATPTTEVSTPFTSPQMVYSDGAEEYIDTRDVPIPVGGDREYIDIPKWMDNKYFNDLRANIMLNYAENQSF